MKSILLLSHYSKNPGPIDKLEQYFREIRYPITSIRFPLASSSGLPILVTQNSLKRHSYVPSFIQFAFEGLVAARLYRNLKQKKESFDLAICLDPLSYFHCFCFRWIYKYKRIVYYSIDYSKKRFKNRLLNFIYQSLHTIAFVSCDYCFCLTKKFIEDTDPQRKYLSKIFLIQHTVDTKHINFHQNRFRNALVYIGNIQGSMDFESLFVALNLLRKDHIPFTFHIYGIDKEKVLNRTIQKFDLDTCVSIKPIETNKRIIEVILPRYGIGVCPYITDRTKGPDHMYLGSNLTTKQVEYLAAGLPIITTFLYPYFRTIERQKIGFIVHDVNSWYQALRRLLLNKTLYQQYHQNALLFSKRYDVHAVFDPVFDKIFGSKSKATE